MAATSYELARQVAASLSHEDQLRLIRELTSENTENDSPREKVSIMELCGLGEEIWKGIDAQQYVDRERDSWNG